MDPLEFLERAENLERSARRSGRYLGLGRMRRLCGRMGHPERAVPLVVHVAGTKGKGSTAAFIAAGLRASGLRTGLYLSPHLLDFGERIRVDGRPIRKAELRRILGPLIQVTARVRPTWFEWVTAAAFEHFRRRKCRAAVLEVGLGGRLDATNVVTPSVCAITRIDYDHMDLLGNTLGKIAAEKAGILKKGIPCVVAPQPPGAMRAIRRIARKVGAPLIRAKPARMRLSMPGAHQRENAGVALAVLRVLGIRDRKALREVALPGRVQILRRRPPLVVDGAHNPLSVRMLGKALKSEFPGVRWTAVFGTASDKDLEGMMKELRSFADKVVAAPFGSPRARSPREVVRSARRAGMEAGEARSVKAALRRVKGPVVVAGSLILAGEALK